ncbi:L,D-transpeptidase family protein [Nocardioides sp. CN2-186]|uniref:L,D-transpeptidase family protein n=1 Tax=Nocardioides tweenelious TaxID=3156607 RepID=UPI0032B403B2
MRRLVVLAVLALVATQSPAAAAADWVAQAQARLNHLGCHAGTSDGQLDRQTRSAVVRFQSRSGIKQTAHLDERTRRLLGADGAPRCDVRPVPSRSGTGRRIVVSQGQNWVWLVGPKGGIVDQGPMVDNPAVLHRGTDATGSYCGRAARIRLNQDASGSVWLDNFVRFAPCGIGFHRIPRAKATGRQIHADWVLGTDMARSHGCIRLGRELSQRVWSFTIRRTPVHVV